MKHALYHGDCLGLSDGPYDLVYLDPPFAVGGGAMASRAAKGQARGRKQAVSGPHAYRDVDDTAAMIALLEPRLARLREQMSDTATLCLHMDYRAVHESKVLADKIFGAGAFRGEVVWAPGNGARGARGFSVTHQTILLYARARRARGLWRTDHPLLREPFAATSLSMHFTEVDGDGRRYRERIIRGKRYRYYADEGRRLGSVWSDIPAMVANTPLMAEGTGYPTQKPERLLERLIRALTEDGACVADPMCGSGTTLVVAARLGRRFVGCDVGDVAIDVTRRRLAAAGVDHHFARL